MLSIVYNLNKATHILGLQLRWLTAEMKEKSDKMEPNKGNIREI